jgi:hypothetical protein
MTNQDAAQNRAKAETNRQRRALAYDYMKALYLKERGIDKFPRKNRAPDYSDFDEWLAQKISSC